MLFATLLFCAQRPPEVPLLGPEPCTFSAILVCGAGHTACHGRATLYLPTEYGPVDIDACDIVCGERFVLTARNAPIVQRQYEELAVELSLEQHAPVGLRSIPMAEGCDMGPWRVLSPALPEAVERAPSRATAVSMGPRCLRIELHGEAAGAISGFAIPDVAALPMMCALGNRSILNPSYATRRVDDRTWELDLDRLEVKRTSFRLFVHTSTGGSVSMDLEDVPTTPFGVRKIEVTAPAADKQVRGRVVDSRLLPVAGAEVGAYLLSTDTLRFVHSDAQGNFLFDGLDACGVWLCVNDRRWRDVDLTGRFETAGPAPGPQVTIHVVPQRRIEIDLSARQLDERQGFVACVRPLDREDRPIGCGLAVHVDPLTAQAPFRIPALWGERFEVSLLPSPVESRVRGLEYGTWIEGDRLASTRIAFPKSGPAGAVRRWRVPARD